MSQYEHTQRAPLYLLLFLFSAFLLTMAWVLRQEPVAIAFPIVGLLMFMLGASFKQLTVSDDGDAIRVAFGPLPLFTTRLKYSEIQDVKPAKISLLDGWGIHYSLRGGWVWNLWGWDCVEVRHHRGVFRIGTDEPQQLSEFLEQRIQTE